ncbi:MAG: hypothetical protein HY868_09885 [Chloroflexi bacterium]|nr:hypothetical protein [Chloroflexota bacterium]
METIELRPDLQQTIEQFARQTSGSVNAIVNQAVENFAREQQREKLNREIAAFESMHAELKRQYLGKWVAIHKGNLVDTDEDVTQLYRRVRTQFGRTSVLIRQVTASPKEETFVRTPSTGKARE